MELRQGASSGAPREHAATPGSDHAQGDSDLVPALRHRMLAAANGPARRSASRGPAGSARPRWPPRSCGPCRQRRRGNKRASGKEDVSPTCELSAPGCSWSKPRLAGTSMPWSNSCCGPPLVSVDRRGRDGRHRDGHDWLGPSVGRRNRDAARHRGKTDPARFFLPPGRCSHSRSGLGTFASGRHAQDLRFRRPRRPHGAASGPGPPAEPGDRAGSRTPRPQDGRRAVRRAAPAAGTAALAAAIRPGIRSSVSTR